MTELEKSYDASKVEDKIYQKWLDSGYFNPDNLTGEPYIIIMPPPNVTGTLHIGHALGMTIQDILIRYHRMKGFKTLWLPGTDHAAIATQAKVETELYKKDGKTRHDFTREEFLTLIENFAKESQNTIIEQIKRLGASCDWSREAYTLDEARSLAVRTAFKKMHGLGLIYRGKRIVNWDPKLQTTVSDDEIEWKEETAPFYYLKYGPFVIGTARPETKFGDKYVVMHPDDKRYAKYKHGDKLELEWINGPVTATVIKDSAVDMEFGTGVMTITPWHDLADNDIADRYDLDFEQIIDLAGKLLPVAGQFAGLHIKKARPLIVEKLQAKGLVEKIDNKYTHRVAINSRGGGIIEPHILEQWFIDVNKEFALSHSKIEGITTGQTVTLKQLMRHAVESGQIDIIPEHFKKIYFHWIDNLRDWCISRQIWYGHRVPVWYRGWAETDLSKIYTMGFHERTEPQVKAGKTVTYRLRDHGVKIGDRFGLLNSQSNNIFGYGTIIDIKKTTVKDTPLHDPAHGATYTKRKELIEAFQFHHPEIKVIEDTPVWIYTYSFGPAKDTEFVEQYVGIEPPLGDTWEQDPDTLDTWFSSGLWTFSTLGWPAQKIWDLKIYDSANNFEALANGTKRFETRAGTAKNSQRDWSQFKIGDVINFSLVEENTEKLLSSQTVAKQVVSIHRFNSIDQLLQKFDLKEIHPYKPEEYKLWWESRPKYKERIEKFGIWAFELKDWDLTVYHPTSVLETGYDILFFWVARMVLMSTALLGQVPFKTVFLHGLVRDKDRQKMSKSKGNIIDPLGVIDSYGTDALRFALIFSTAAGNDIPLSEDKIKGMKHFGNKLWNISRYILMNVTELKVENEKLKVETQTEADKTIIEKLHSTVAEVTVHLDEFRLHEAAQSIYQFTWHDFADIYIEESKKQLADENLRQNTEAILLYCLIVILKLLHPFMPFITEEIWSKFNQKDLLMVAEWPK